MPSVATIESVLRLSAPVQLRVSAPVQFRLGPASQRAECREVSVPDWLVDWLPPSAEWSRAENVCAGLAGRLAAADRRVEQSRVDWLSVPVQPFPNRPPRARECLSPISVLSRIGWSIGCHRAQSGAESVCPCSTSPVRPPGQDHPFGLLSPISLGKCLSQIGWSIGCRRTQSEAESVCPRSACFCCAQRLSVLNQFLQSVSPRGCLSRPSPDHPGPVSAGGVKTVELISVNCSD